MATETKTFKSFDELEEIMNTCLRPYQIDVLRKLYNDGISYEEVAKGLKVTVNRVHQIEARAMQPLRRKLDAMNKPTTSYEIDKLGLSARSKNVLVSAGYTTIEAVAALTEDDFRTMRNATSRVYREVREKLATM